MEISQISECNTVEYNHEAEKCTFLQNTSYCISICDSGVLQTKLSMKKYILLSLTQNSVDFYDVLLKQLYL